MLNNILLVFHVLISIGIIGLILLQQGKGADAGAAFGAGASGTVFGAQGSGTFLSRATAILAALFFATSLGLAYLANEGVAPSDDFSRTFNTTTDKDKKVDEKAADKVEEKAPVAEKEKASLPTEESGTPAKDAGSDKTKPDTSLPVTE